MEIIRLTIPNMKSNHCQMRVANAVKEIGAEVRQIAPMQAHIELKGGATKKSLIKAIETAGYRVSGSE